MPAPTMIITPATALQANVQFNATESDKVLFAVNGVALTASDAITFSVANSTNGKTPVYNAAGTQVTLGPTLQSVMLEGGFLYIIDKSVTAAASGLDVSIKPREGP